MSKKVGSLRNITITRYGFAFQTSGLHILLRKGNSRTWLPGDVVSLCKPPMNEALHSLVSDVVLTTVGFVRLAQNLHLEAHLSVASLFGHYLASLSN